MDSIKKPQVLLVTQAQVVLLLVITMALFVFDSTLWLSCFVGGLIAVIPHLYFSVYAFRYVGAQFAQKATQAFYWGETGKFLITLIGFALVFLFFEDLNFKAFFASYCSFLLVQLYLTEKIIRNY